MTDALFYFGHRTMGFLLNDAGRSRAVRWLYLPCAITVLIAGCIGMLTLAMVGRLLGLLEEAS